MPFKLKFILSILLLAFFTKANLLDSQSTIVTGDADNPQTLEQLYDSNFDYYTNGAVFTGEVATSASWLFEISSL